MKAGGTRRHTPAIGNRVADCASTKGLHSSEVENRMGLSLSEMKDHRRGRPRNTVETMGILIWSSSLSAASARRGASSTVSGELPLTSGSMAVPSTNSATLARDLGAIELQL